MDEVAEVGFPGVEAVVGRVEALAGGVVEAEVGLAEVGMEVGAAGEEVGASVAEAVDGSEGLCHASKDRVLWWSGNCMTPALHACAQVHMIIVMSSSFYLVVKIPTLRGLD